MIRFFVLITQTKGFYDYEPNCRGRKARLQGLNCFHAGIGEKVKQARTFEGNLRFLCLKFEFQRQEEEEGEEGH